MSDFTFAQHVTGTAPLHVSEMSKTVLLVTAAIVVTKFSTGGLIIYGRLAPETIVEKRSRRHNILSLKVIIENIQKKCIDSEALPENKSSRGSLRSGSDGCVRDVTECDPTVPGESQTRNKRQEHGYRTECSLGDRAERLDWAGRFRVLYVGIFKREQ